MERLKCVGGALEFRYDSETVWVEAWGKDSLRVRATRLYEMPKEDWALLKQEESWCEINISETEGTIRNGKIAASDQSCGKAADLQQCGKTAFGRIRKEPQGCI